jgi:hypothetical protein
MSRMENLVGRRFNRLVVVALEPGRPRVAWRCKCDCGKEAVVAAAQLKSDHTRSCGCLQRERASATRFVDLAGRVFGRLTVQARAAAKSYTENSVWRCRCECGNERDVVSLKLVSGHTKSCGCLKAETTRARARTHGMSESREFHAWAAAKQRCTNPKNKAYPRYGGAGIRMCDAWLNSFETFLRDMGPAPTQRHTIDRFPDKKGNYEPGNTRWATPTEQANNVRTNRSVTFDGRTLTVAQWERELEMPAGRIKSRLLAGWPVERALTAPVR